MIDAVGYIRKQKSDIELIVQPKIGQSTTMIGKYKNIDECFKTILKKTTMYVIKGGILEKNKASWLDKVYDFIKIEF